MSSGFGFILFFAVALARGRVSNITANLCVEGKLELESGVDIYSAIGQQYFVLLTFLDRCAVGWFIVR